MKRRHIVLGAIASVAVAAACTSLFEDAVQCTLDIDCAAFPGTACGQDRTCIPAELVDGSFVVPSGDAGADGDLDGIDGAPVDCPPVGSRPLASIPGEVLDGAPGTAILTNTRLTCEKDWELADTVIVRPGATLVIDKSVVLRGQANSRLIVQPGAALRSDGTATEPVVITSVKAPADRVAGDFLGVYILGRVTAGGYNYLNDPLLSFGGNNFGGAQADESSGVLRYMRVEYARDGLRLVGVGRATTFDHVQVRHTVDDALTIVTGNVNGKYLAVQHPGDEGFFLTGNYTGKLQFLVGQSIGDRLDRQGILIEGGGNRATIYNATFCGRATANRALGMLVRDGARCNVRNSIVMGYAAGFDQVANAGVDMDISNCVFFGQYVDNYAYEEDAGEADLNSPYFDDDLGFDEKAFLSEEGRGNTMNNPQIARCFDVANPDFAPNAAVAGPEPPDDGFFDRAANYRGAVKDGADGWTKEPWLVWAAE